MPVVERFAYPRQFVQHVPPKSAPTYRQPKQVNSDIPSQLSFQDPTTLLNFISSLTSPKQLVGVTSLSVRFTFAYDPRHQWHQNILMGLSVLLRHLINLDELTLYWDNVPSSALNGVSFHLTVFESWMPVDHTTIAFLDTQRDLRTLDLREWGSHLPPRHAGSSSQSRRKALTAPPPELSSSSLPNLVEFSGHAEVASQLALGRPLQVVNMTEGFESETNAQEWREIMAGLAQSTHWVGTLSIATLETFSLEMLAEIGRHLQALDYLHLRVNRGPYIGELFHWDHWKNYLIPLVELEQIEIELVEDWRQAPRLVSAGAVVCNLPTSEHMRQWHRTCPLLSSVSVSIAGGPKLVHWRWENLAWVDAVSGRR